MSVSHRRPRLAVALTLSLTLASAAIAPALGATANIGVGGGVTVGQIERGATPLAVQPGNVVGFYLWAKNNDSANLATFFLTAQSTATYVGAYWWNPALDPADRVYTDCGTSAFNCEFGALNSGSEVAVLVAYKTTSASTKNCNPNHAAAGAAGDEGFYPTSSITSFQCVQFQFGSHSGFVPDSPDKKKGNNSRGDAYNFYDFVELQTSNDEAGQFPFCNRAVEGACDGSSLLTVFDGKNLGKNNPQWTQVVAPPQALNSSHGTTALYVADNVDFKCFDVTEITECANATLGQWSQIDVNTGQYIPDGWIEISNGIYGVNANKISAVYHFYFDVGLQMWVLEKITTLCGSSAGPATTSSPACFWVQSLQGNASEVTYWSHHNGFGKYG